MILELLMSLAMDGTIGDKSEGKAEVSLYIPPRYEIEVINEKPVIKSNFEFETIVKDGIIILIPPLL